MNIRWLLVAFAFLAISFSQNNEAIAQTGGGNVTVIKGKDRTIFRKKTVIDFEDSTVEGDLVKPEQSAYTVRGRAKFNSLIRYRPNFVPEMWKAARNL